MERSRVHCFLSRDAAHRTSRTVPELFDMKLRALRRDRAARIGPELFLLDRAFDDCLERVALMNRRFERALLIGCPNPNWPDRFRPFAEAIRCRDPGPLFAGSASGASIVEDGWDAPAQAYDLVAAVGTLDTVNNLPLALRLIRHAMRADSLLIGAVSGGDIFRGCALPCERRIRQRGLRCPMSIRASKRPRFLRCLSMRASQGRWSTSSGCKWLIGPSVARFRSPRYGCHQRPHRRCDATDTLFARSCLARIPGRPEDANELWRRSS